MMSIASIYEIFKRYPRVSTDSRSIEADSIFFALKGGNFDGNKFAAMALESGAAYVVVDDRSVVAGERYLLVEDVLEALQQLAAHHRRQLGMPVLAITGSNGKTTTKELVSRVLARKFAVSVTKGNLNNHIGVPLTLLKIDHTCTMAVVEMGASACGEIAQLCEITAPDYGIITNIGRAHLEGFGGEDGVRRGKGELLDYLAAHGGVGFYLSDDPVLTDMSTSRVGFDEELRTGDAEFRTGLRVGLRAGLRAVAYSCEGVLPKSNLVGDYNRYNVAAAVAIGRYFDISDSDIAAAVASYEPDNNRSQRVATDSNELILDCYNANPSSMAASLANFAAEQSARGFEKCAVLGDMLELGEFSHAEHQAVLRQAEECGIKMLYLVGANFCDAAAEYAPQNYTILRFIDRTSLVDYLNKTPLKNRFVLIKGSRGIGLEKVVALL